MYVAVIDSNVVGYVHANDYDVIYAPHMKDIMGIAVSSNYQKMGIGKALLNAVEDWAINTGACGIRLVSGVTRIDAHDFYRHCDYSGDKQQINFKKMFYHN
ncbi:MAG: GNAT family N-acetyltransferase [Erysipelotrichaceae bacterium]|nr:GNAT family N-acetyltransferase [Erysipelotrichaceae bacterium]